LVTRYDRWFSDDLSREMEIKSYGHGGKPVLFIPCQEGRFFDFENFGLIDAFAPFIDEGLVTVFCVDTVDMETWSATGADPARRAERHEAWMRYLAYDAAGYIRECRGEQGILAYGASLGSLHAANLYFRFPETFDAVLCLSGVYTASYGFGDYMDGTVYLNSPVDYLANMPWDHPYLGLYRQNKAVFCVGQGPWEEPHYTRDLEYILHQKGIPAWVDYWGYDVSHDWPWWKREVPYFLPHLL
jgi:esterase/lipase superfamily enzyme